MNICFLLHIYFDIIFEILTVIKICILPCPTESLQLKGLKAPVAQLDRVAPSEGVGRTFESSRVRHSLKFPPSRFALTQEFGTKRTRKIKKRGFCFFLTSYFVRTKISQGAPLHPQLTSSQSALFLLSKHKWCDKIKRGYNII